MSTKGTLAEIPDSRPTEASRNYATEQPIPNEKPIVENQAVEQVAPGTDWSSLSKRERTKYGIKDDEDHRWVLDTSGTSWASHLHYDRIGEVQDASEARLIKNEDGSPVRRRDLVLMAVPKAVVEEYHRKEAEEMRNFLATVSDEIAVEGKAQNADIREQERIRDENKRLVRQMGIAGDGSNTQGLSLKQAVSMRTQEQIDDEMTYYRTNGRVTSARQVQNGLDKAVETAKAGQKGSATFGGLTGKMDNWNRTGDRASARR